MIGTQSYNTIIKIAGDEVTLKRFDKTFTYGYQSKNKKENTTRGESKNLEDNFNRSVSRARQKMFDIVNCNINRHTTPNGDNPTPKFVTLTFADNITDYNYAVKEFTNFNKRLSYQLFKLKTNVLKYIAVPEYQERGAIHFHVIYFNLPYINFDLLSTTWDMGYVFINKIKDDITNYAKYIVPYMNNASFDLYKDKGLLNKRRYYTSKGLKRPKELRVYVESDLISDLMNKLGPYKVGEYDTKGEFMCVYNDSYSLPPGQYDNDIVLFSMLRDIIDTHMDMFRVPITTVQ